MRDAASTRSGVGGGSTGGHAGYPGLEPAPALTEELKRHLAESRAATEYRSTLAHHSLPPLLHFGSQ